MKKPLDAWVTRFLELSSSSSLAAALETILFDQECDTATRQRPGSFLVSYIYFKVLLLHRERCQKSIGYINRDPVQDS